MDIHQALKKYFGYDSFRQPQEEIIKTILSGRDSFVLMPTGGGKSICFQIPALVLPGCTICISPLIALMKDQVEGLRENGVAAAYLNSSLNYEQEELIVEQAKNGILKLLYISPEKAVALSEFFFRQLKINLIAIDEAHCISQWGHDFRPEYTKLQSLRDKLPGVPVIALTASADKLCRKDIITQLGLNDPAIFITSFDRPNLRLAVRSGLRQADKIEEVYHFIRNRPSSSGIIYCLSRKNTEELTEHLKLKGINAAYYHAGMDSEERSKVQDQFVNDEVPVICATIAFGMGIDKSNIRWILHYNLPKSMEGFYQEIGRAGRDGLESDTLLFYSLGDLTTLGHFASTSAQPEIQLEKLQRMQHYAESFTCRRKILLSYFGEIKNENCGNCDVCTNPPNYVDGTSWAIQLIKSVQLLNEKISTGNLILVLRGSQSSEIRENGYHLVSIFGSGKELSGLQWLQVIMQFIHEGLFEIAYDEANSLKLTSKALSVLKGEQKVLIAEIKVKEKRKRKEQIQQNIEKKNEDHELFEVLRQLRLDISKKEALAPYIVFHDKTLKEMCRILPENKEEMLEVSGISEKKFEKYGSQFLRVIREYQLQS